MLVLLFTLVSIIAAKQEVFLKGRKLQVPSTKAYSWHPESQGLSLRVLLGNNFTYLKGVHVFLFRMVIHGNQVCFAHSLSDDIYYLMGVWCFHLYLYIGSCEEQKLVLDGLEHKKNKANEVPWSDLCWFTSLQRQSEKEPSRVWGQEEGPSPGSPQRNPANNLPAPVLGKKTESALCDCAVLLAWLTLGLDFRDLHGVQSPEELSPKEEEDEERTLQCASRSRSRPCLRQPAAGREPSGAPSLPMLAVTDLSSRLSLSRRCPLQMAKDKTPTKNTQLTPESCSADLESSCQPIPVPRLETEHSVLRSPSPALLEQSDENLPVCASTGDRALHHRWMVLDQTPFKSLSRWQHSCGKAQNLAVENKVCAAWPHNFTFP